ncbi:hypothetical protein PLICRDRAFT_179686 [Plicaturopsis crispa FD-325 SS-3]|uniref:Beta-lactamase-related domain-containing protein n=1 Tax=Plicaturopsis crispa FD-325 SS-3 TaxID=944288 RepID=A0A0C9T524_PLICR|nr:hypothetical protein PLICRDRAFT_179686 [Plicaturopsis crispa FD-325 SS-3]
MSTTKLKAQVDALIQEAVKETLPFAVFTAYARDGSPIVSSFGGVLSLADEPPKPVTVDTVGYMASCTKLLTSIACLQCVERGLIKLDDPVGDIVRQVDELEILEGYGQDGKPKLRKPTNRITLRHLLTHTSGLSYGFYSETLTRWLNESKDNYSSYLAPEGTIFRPLEFEPGERFRYGVSLDVAGVVVETLTNLSLGDYIEKNITRPLQVDQHFSFFTDDFVADGRLASIYNRGSDQRLSPAVPRLRSKKDEDGSYLCPGGHGSFCSAPAYCQVLLTLVNQGVHPKLHTRILEAETVALLTSPQFDPVTQSQVIADLNHTGFIPNPEIIPGHSWHNYKSPELKKNHGLGGIIFQEGWKTGRSGHCMSWSGMCNSNWWIDIDKGVVGFFLAQVLPFGDPYAFGLFEQLETAVYEDLAVPQNV